MHFFTLKHVIRFTFFLTVMEKGFFLSIMRVKISTKKKEIVVKFMINALLKDI